MSLLAWCGDIGIGFSHLALKNQEYFNGGRHCLGISVWVGQKQILRTVCSHSHHLCGKLGPDPSQWHLTHPRTMPVERQRSGGFNTPVPISHWFRAVLGALFPCSTCSLPQAMMSGADSGPSMECIKMISVKGYGQESNSACYSGCPCGRRNCK